VDIAQKSLFGVGPYSYRIGESLQPAVCRVAGGYGVGFDLSTTEGKNAALAAWRAEHPEDS
jgi:hypothetical protein